jgi:hypothetical protein
MNGKKQIAMLKEFSANPQNVRFVDICSLCTHFFGPPRHKSSSHHVFKTPWAGDPRVNIQNKKGMAKSYQVKQVLKAIAKMDENHDA